MRARILDYYGNWASEILECPTCGWKGTFNEGNKDWGTVCDSSCPACSEGPMLAVLDSSTSPSAYKAKRHELSKTERAFGDAQLAAIGTRASAHFLTVIDFPDLEGGTVDFVWDDDGREVVIRHQDIEIGREPGGYENYHRFLELIKILEARYGTRLRTFNPTERSWFNLLGDKSGSHRLIEAELKRIRDAWEAVPR